jgi:hypothetical protein
MKALSSDRQSAPVAPQPRYVSVTIHAHAKIGRTTNDNCMTNELCTTTNPTSPRASERLPRVCEQVLRGPDDLRSQSGFALNLLESFRAGAP